MDTVIYPVKDLDAAKEFFSSLFGCEPYADTPYYVGFQVGDQEFGLNPNGHAQGMAGPIGYVTVDDVGASIAALVELGATEHQGATDVGGGKLIAVVVDGDGNQVGLTQNP